MKYLLTFLGLFISAISFSQVDSSRSKISLSITAKDCEYVVKTFEKSNKFEDLDSTLKKKFRGASPPSNNNNVTIDSVEVRVYRSIMQMLRDDVVAVQNNVYKRISDLLIANGNAWIIDKLSKDLQVVSDQYDQIRTIGRAYLTKAQTN